MNLNLTGRLFIVCGASSGFGRTIAEVLLQEGAEVIAVARRKKKLEELQSVGGEYVAGDISLPETQEAIMKQSDGRPLTGLVLNSGGPPTGAAEDITASQWDEAYNSVFRWKTELVQRVLPLLKSRSYGRILFVESQSIKQPIPNLALSNAMRAAVAGYAKTLAGELAGNGITVNTLAPGSHDTPAIERVIESRSQSWGVPYEEARTRMESGVPVQRFGKPEEMASLAAWLLSDHSGYVTGQVISHAGGSNTSLFG